MLYNKFYNGIGKSRSDQSSFDDLTNVDIHAEIGFCRPQLALVADSSTNVPDEQTLLLKTPSDTIYAFSRESGKIWKLTSGTWSVVTANANTSGHMGVFYYNGFVYYSTNTKLGRLVTDTEASRNDSFHTFSNSSNNKPMAELNLTLFIGNGSDLASVNSNDDVSDSALDLPPTYEVNSLAGVGTDLLVGTYSPNNTNSTKAFLWDTYSDSWSVEDDIPERGVDAFVKADNTVFAICGHGQEAIIYYWNGSRLEKFKKLRGTLADVTLRNNVTVLNGRVLIGLVNKIFSIHRESNDMNFVVAQEFTLTAAGTIRSMTTIGDTLYVSYDDGINKTGTGYANAIINTPEVTGRVQRVNVYYDSIPDNTSITIYTKSDGGAWTAQTSIKDTVNKVVYFDGKLGDTNFVQARALLTSSGTAYPVIRGIELL